MAFTRDALRGRSPFDIETNPSRGVQRRKPNASLLAVPELIGDPVLRSSVQTTVDEAVQAAQFASGLMSVRRLELVTQKARAEGRAPPGTQSGSDGLAV